MAFLMSGAAMELKWALKTCCPEMGVILCRVCAMTCAARTHLSSQQHWGCSHAPEHGEAGRAAHVLTSKQMFSPSRSQSSLRQGCSGPPLSSAAQRGQELGPGQAHQRTRWVQPLASDCRCLQMWACSTRFRRGCHAACAGMQQVCKTLGLASFFWVGASNRERGSVSQFWYLAGKSMLSTWPCVRGMSAYSMQAITKGHSPSRSTYNHRGHLQESRPSKEAACPFMHLLVPPTGVHLHVDQVNAQLAARQVLSAAGSTWWSDSMSAMELARLGFSATHSTVAVISGLPCQSCRMLRT